jgi:ABC-type spermidine/putrescine transport system permease subunit II
MGRAAAARSVRPGPPSSRWNVALWIYVGVFFIFLYGPLLTLVMFSFNDAEVVALPFRGLTLKWYRAILDMPELLHSLANSFAIGAMAGAISTILGLGLALGFRRDFMLKPMLLRMILIPIVVPGIIGGVVLLLFFGYLGIPFGLYTTVLIAHINWTLPFTFLTLYPRLHRFDRSIEEAAMDLGARPVTVFRRIVLPLITPAIYATFLFSFTLSFDEFIRTIFVLGSGRTVPVHVWSLVIEQIAPFLPAVGVVIMLISIAASLLGLLVTARGDRTAVQAKR